MEEIWKDIKNYEDKYQVSNLGRIRSKNRILVYKNGRNRPQKEKIMTPYKARGYLGVVLYSDCSRKSFLVHRLVADAFLPNTDNKEEVNHKNGNKYDNNVKNLEWVTHSENNLHCYRVLKRKLSCLGKFGKEHPCSKIVARICIKTGEKTTYNSMTEASKNNLINIKTISNCCCGRQKTGKGYKWEIIDKRGYADDRVGYNIRA